MLKENINNLPLVVLRDTHELIQEFEELYKQNSDIVQKTELILKILLNS